MILFNGNNIIKGRFPNGEKQYYDFSESLRYKQRNIIEVIFEDNEDLFDLAMIKYWFDDHAINGATVELIMKFCPYGQSDRQMGDAMFSFKYFAHFINSLNFNQVTIYDPHSFVMECAINKCLVINRIDGINLNEYDLLFYPDNGAAKKYSEIYKYPYRFGNKKRNLDTGEIICYEVIADKKDIEGKKILIIDDICMGGRTFKEAAKALLSMDAAQVDLHITHLMPQAHEFYYNCNNFGITNFYTCDTLNIL